jgi:hypothetical protein
MKNHEECGTCKFWLSCYSHCRKHPPVMLLDPDSNDIRAWWPETSINDWCGEHEPKE